MFIIIGDIVIIVILLYYDIVILLLFVKLWSLGLEGYNGLVLRGNEVYLVIVEGFFFGLVLIVLRV